MGRLSRRLERMPLFRRHPTLFWVAVLKAFVNLAIGLSFFAVASSNVSSSLRNNTMVDVLPLPAWGIFFLVAAALIAVGGYQNGESYRLARYGYGIGAALAGMWLAGYIYPLILGHFETIFAMLFWLYYGANHLLFISEPTHQPLATISKMRERNNGAGS